MNELAPEKELRVALRVLFRATTHCRNLALNPATPHKKIEDLMDAINHLPEMLTRWESFEEQTMLLHFATYDEKWCGPNDCFSLKQTYSDLKKFGVVY
jgi:hypothetical protein